MVTERTLRNWQAQAQQTGCGPLKPGPVAKGITFSERLRVAREWKRQGYTGSRPVMKALGCTVRVRVVREMVAELKLRREKRHQAVQSAVRVRVKVKKSGTVVTMDGATVKKGEDHIVYRDRGSLSVKSRACRGNLQAADTLALLEKLKETNRLPLVMCSDNGPQFCSKNVRQFLEINKVVHLRNLPYVPEHNGSCENAVKEFKGLLKEKLSPDKASQILTENRRRQQLNYQTSAEFERENFQEITTQERTIFYEAAKDAIKWPAFELRLQYQGLVSA
jgi:transposase InsO family protein